ncbi:MAG TPA: NADH-ubiquinone oxidoreductase-F iron-sulfur binding region domain-containing protein [Syntrophorhabdaceae bacterium]|nr:NADH-ubiquinone oxidoreductase-F iron-sulfur binding region domain-containing protein [Syntrophorhabdaceae bacterium]
MNFEQVTKKAYFQYHFRADAPCVRVTVAAAPEVDVSEQVTLFKKWSEKDGRHRRVITGGSFGYYDLEPLVIIEKPGRSTILYPHVTANLAFELIPDCIEGDDPRPDLALCLLGGEEIRGIPTCQALPMFSLQKRVALRNCGRVDPENIDSYIAGCGGYAGLSGALDMSPFDVMEEVRRSRLRDRRDGQPTVEKWKIVRDAGKDEKYVICSAVDSDAQARTARLLLQSDPHTVLEGMLITANAVAASRCIVVVPSGDDDTLKKLRKALVQMRDYDLVGEDILGSGFSCDIEIREMAPSLLSGEESALLSWLAGGQPVPEPRNRPGMPPLLWGKPVIVNDAETLANVAAFLQRGAAWFAGIGTTASAGSKVIDLAGEMVHQYTVEVPFGTTLSDVVRQIGGVSAGEPIKAVQFGGPTGSFFSADDSGLTIDYGNLDVTGSTMGSGRISVIAHDACAVEMTEHVMSYLQTQSCGKCVFCREGTLQISEILEDVARGEGRPQDIDLLTELGEAMRAPSLCGLGRNASNPVLSSIRLFRHEYDAHIKQKKCTQGHD